MLCLYCGVAWYSPTCANDLHCAVFYVIRPFLFYYFYIHLINNKDMIKLKLGTR